MTHSYLLDPFCALLVLLCATRQLAGHRNIVGMLGLCDTTIVAEYHQSFLGVLLRDGRELPVVEVVSMALDAARGLQVHSW